MAKITFLGGAKSVTGANYLIEFNKTRVLVDCGLLQGTSYAEEFNYLPFSYNPKLIDYVLLTHSHADHSGRLPKLYREGFRGKLLTSGPTLEIIRVALPDNLGLVKEEAENHGHEPLFNQSDLDGVLSLSEGIDYEREIDLGEIRVVFHDAGHILGSAIIEIRYENKKIFFTGDLGNPPTPFLNQPYLPDDGDYVVIESAYGGRIHEDFSERKIKLLRAIERTITRGGTVMIPSFAIERTQQVLFELNDFINERNITRVPIFVDSPLASKLTEVYKKNSKYFSQEAQTIIKSGDDIFDFPGLRFTNSVIESKSINNIKGSKIIIAGSGMSNGGRILHHEIRYLPDPRSCLVIVGYQVEGSIGRKIIDGAKSVKIFGEHIPVNCEIVAIGGNSAHAEQNGLNNWAASVARGGKLKDVFIVQGEEEAANDLAKSIKSTSGVECTVPSSGDSFEI